MDTDSYDRRATLRISAAVMAVWLAQHTNQLGSHASSLLAVLGGGAASGVRASTATIVAARELLPSRVTPRLWAQMSDRELTELAARSRRLASSRPLLGELAEIRHRPNAAAPNPHRPSHDQSL